MIAVRLKYVYADRDRHGNERIYFWYKGGRGGQRKIRLHEPQGSAGFMARYQDLLREAATGDGRTATGGERSQTFIWLCRRYMASPQFRALDASTQRTRSQILAHACDEPVAPDAPATMGDCPLERMTGKHVRVLRDRKVATPAAANNRLKSIRRVFAWAAEDEVWMHNPAAAVRKLVDRGAGHHTWTEDEVARFEARHEVGSRARLALGLLLLTGVRRSDLVQLGRQHQRQGRLVFTAHKGRQRHPVTIDIPVLPALARLIAASPCGDLHYLVTAYGRPFTSNGFGNWFRARCNEAGLPHCSAHGLRKAGAVTAAENGASVHQLMAIFGWLGAREAERYTKAAERKRLATDGMRHLER